VALFGFVTAGVSAGLVGACVTCAIPYFGTVV